MSPALARAAVEHMLLDTLGAVESPGDHRWFEIRVNDRVTVRTKLSRGSGRNTISSDLVAAMARQCRVSIGDFTRLVAGDMTREQWVEKVLRHPDTRP